MSPKSATTPPVVEPTDKDAASSQKLADTQKEIWDRLAAKVRADISAGLMRPMPCPAPSYPQVILGMVEQLVAQGIPLDHIHIPDLTRQPAVVTSVPPLTGQPGVVWISDDFNDPLEEFADYM